MENLKGSAIVLMEKQLENYKKKVELRREVIDKIWDIAKISPEHGNALMDFLGDELYVRIAQMHTHKEEN